MMTMTSQWTTAFMQLRAFISVEQSTCKPEVFDELSEFLLQNLHDFTLLDALAMATLTEEPPDLDNFVFKNPPKVGCLTEVPMAVYSSQGESPEQEGE